MLKNKELNRIVISNIMEELKPEKLRKLLIPVHLHYDLGSRPLKARAVAGIVLKMLEGSEPKKFPILSSEVSSLLDIKKISDNDLRLGIEFLKENHLLDKTEKGYKLTRAANNKIKKDIEESRERLSRTLHKYFPESIEEEILTKWFHKSIAKFFGEYGDVWVKALYRTEDVPKLNKEHLEKVVTSTANQYKLQYYLDSLLEGFRSFLKDYKDPETAHQIWDFGEAMFAAKLITASTGPDPITIQKFNKARFFLDTNVLILAALEKSKSAKMLGELIAVLQSIGVSLYLIQPTINEYKRLVSRKKDETLNVLEKGVTLEILKASEDPFIKTAISRECSKKEDFERFFETIEDPLRLFSEDTKISVRDNPEIEKVIGESQDDSRRCALIAEEWEKYHSWKKPIGSIQHDAALSGVVDFLRKNQNENVWAITRDRSIDSLSRRLTKDFIMQSWISLDVLVQILAISGAGPKHNPENFAPLLGALIESEVFSGPKTFEIEDVNALYNLEERVKELSDDEIIDFAKRISELRLEGKRIAGGEIQLLLRRTFERKGLDASQELAGWRTRALGAEESERSKEKDIKRIKQFFVKERAKKTKQGIHYKYGSLALLLILMAVLLIYVGWQFFVSQKIELAITFWLAAAFNIIVPIFSLPQKWRDAAKKAEQIAEQYIEEKA